MARRNDDYSELENLIVKLKYNEIDPGDAAAILEDFLADLTTSRSRGRPKHDWYTKMHNPIRMKTKTKVKAEEERLRAETGKKRVKTKAVNNVAEMLCISADAIWKRIGK